MIIGFFEKERGLRPLGMHVCEKNQSNLSIEWEFVPSGGNGRVVLSKDDHGLLYVYSNFVSPITQKQLIRPDAVPVIIEWLQEVY